MTKANGPERHYVEDKEPPTKHEAHIGHNIFAVHSKTRSDSDA